MSVSSSPFLEPHLEVHLEEIAMKESATSFFVGPVHMWCIFTETGQVSVSHAFAYSEQGLFQAPHSQSTRKHGLQRPCTCIYCTHLDSIPVNDHL